MPNPLLVLPAAGAKIYRAGRIGFDTNFQDIGSVNYTCRLKSEPQTPEGEAAEVRYRGIGLRLLRQGAFKLTMKVFVDGNQTLLKDGSLQSIFFDLPSTGSREDVLEAAIRADGTDVAVELLVTSNDITSFLLVEEALAFFVPIAQALRTPAVETQ